MMGQLARTAGALEDSVLQIGNAWAGLDRRKQIIAVLAGLAVFAGILMMSRLATQPSYRLLYSGLEAGTAGEVVRALEQNGAIYEVRGGSIYVDGARRDELRMTLAAEGLPANGGRGYELLDGLSGFGTTSQMFDAAYWRAKEGELARTIVSAPYVSLARVHIANTGTNPFQRSVEPSASVSVTATGAAISATQAEALRHLVASAVAGLSVDNVTIIDADGTLIGSEDTATGSATALSRADELRQRVTRLVEARVGQGNAFVEVSVDTVTESETIRERRLDPAGRVAISTDTEERANTSSSRAGDVSVNSNLPDGDAGTGDDSKAQTSETRERINYEVSETERELRRVPGEVRRLTVAVLVNGAQTDPGGAFAARPEEELAALRELVESTVGFDAARGDVITIKSMSLPEVAPLGTTASAGFFSQLHIDVMSIAQMLILGVVVLLLGLFVVRPLLARPAPPLALPAVARPADQMGAALTGEIETGDIADGPAGSDPVGRGELAVADASAPGAASGAPVDRLRAMIGDRQEETVELLRSWLEDAKEDA